MEIAKANETLATYKKGTNTWVLRKKELANGVSKIVAMLVRLGIEYSHMKGVEVKGGGYGTHINEYLKVFNNGNVCLMAYKPSLDIAPIVVYELDGNEITKEQAMAVVNNNKLFKSSTPSNVYCLSLKDIVAIGTKDIALAM